MRAGVPNLRLSKYMISVPLDNKYPFLKRMEANAPSIEVTLDEPMQITGWVTPSNDPNDDNVGFWAASNQIIQSWQYTVIAKP